MTTPTTVQVQIQLRADTAANWASENPTLLANEVGLETDTKKLKVGDGTTAWNTLAYFPSIVTGGTVLGNLEIGTTGTLTFEGSSADNFETTLGVVNPTADRTINLPNVSGTVITTGDTGTVTSTMIADSTIVNGDISASAAIAHSKLATITAGYVLIGNASNIPTATQVTGDVTISSTGVTAISSGVIVDNDISASAEIAVSKLANGAARQLLQTDAAGTGVEWTDDVDVPGTLDVTGAATFDDDVTIEGDLTVNGTTTTIDTETLLVKDKNIELAVVDTPTDTTADGGGITLKGATDKTITWSDTTDAWTSNQVLDVPAGSAATPSLIFGADVNSGIYSPGADQVAISTNGAQRATIDADGRLLVGTSSARGNFFNSTGIAPRLQVEGNSAETAAVSIVRTSNETQAPSVIFGKMRSSSYGIVSANDDLGRLLFMGADGSELVEAASIIVEVDGTPSANDMPGRIVMSTTSDGASSPTERLRIDSSGRVGIGTTSPGAELHVNPGAGNVGNIYLDYGTGSSADGRLNIEVGSTFVSYETVKTGGLAQAWYVTGGEAMRIDTGKRLLVGTSTAPGNGSWAPNSKLVSIGNTDGTNSAAVLTLGIARAASTAPTNNDIGVITFTGNDGYEFGRIQCQADAAAGSGDYPGRLVFSTTADGASSPTERMRISQNGFIDMPGVYNFTTANAANVNVDGSGGMRRSTSSKKYKTDIETLQDSYADSLLNCRPVWYRSTCEADCPEHSYWGFIAEEVAAIDPRLVHWKTIDITYGEDGSVIETPCEPEPEGVAYDRFVPHLLNLIKRQGEAIAQLQAEVAALKGA